MSAVVDQIKNIDWKNGVISRDEAEKFVSRFAMVLLKFGIQNLEKK